MTASAHSAAPSALGYAAQIEHGLLALLNFAFREPASLTMEIFDDIETLAGGERSYTQIKNKPGTTRNLTDQSPDVWSTLDNWRAAWLDRAGREVQRFSLMTTQTAAPDSALAHLRPSSPQRSPAQAADRLTAAAETSVSETTSAARADFLALSPAERETMLRCVEVHDAATPSGHVEDQLLGLNTLRAATDPGRVPSLVAHLRGWWTARAIKHLHLVASGEPDRITSAELEEQIHDARRQHSDAALPVYDMADPQFTAEDLRPGSDDDMYLRQLWLIDASAQRKARARRSFQRAYAHRSLWGRRGLITDTELETYEEDLTEEWELHRDELAETPCTNEADERRQGMELLTRAELRVTLPLRAELHQPFVQRGTYHSLAHRRCLGWHPRWQPLLEAINATSGARP